MFARLIRSSGHIVHTADGYQAALDVAKRERIDLVVCDIGLWDGDGCDLLGDLQKLQQLKAIALTGFTLAEEVERYRDAGFAAVLRKPLKPLELASAIAQLTSAQTIDPAARNVEPSPHDLSTARAMTEVRAPAASSGQKFSY